MSKIAVLNEFSIEAVRDALQKLDDFRKLVVNGLTAFELNELEKIDPVLFEAVAVVVVAVPAEEADIDEACTDGYPGRTEVNDTEFVKHVPPSLIEMRGAAWDGSNKIHRHALLFA